MYTLLLPFQLLLAAIFATFAMADSQGQVKNLAPFLSKQASVSFNASSAPRWSDYKAPKGLAIVNVATEDDVAHSVAFLTKYNIPFLTQAGAHGWSDSINLPPYGVIINMRGLNSIVFNADKTQATIGGGAIASEAIAAAYDNNTQIMTGNCDTTGVLGAALGGGYGNLLGEHGFSIDQFLSMNVVLADGTKKTITSADTDLWWAMRGAGPNFGIVTSAVVKSFPTPQAQSTAYLGPLFFDESKLEQLVQAINDLKLQPNMNIYLYYIANQGVPSILSTIFYLGDEAGAKQAFASIWALGPVADYTAQTPYNKWNAGAAALNAKGGRKPAYGAAMVELVPATWRTIWTNYKALMASDPGYANSLVICEAYSLINAQAAEPNGPGTAASFPGRHLRFNVAAIPWYYNSTLDKGAEAFGSAARDAWRSTSGLSSPATYVNFAFGDESNQIVYQNSTARLTKLKSQYDPHNVFGYWFDVKN